jgi:hypothetical protein
MTTTTFDLSTPEGRALAKIRCGELQAELDEWAKQFELRSGGRVDATDYDVLQKEMGGTLSEINDLGRRLFDAENAAAAARSATCDPTSAAARSAEKEKNTTGIDE